MPVKASDNRLQRATQFLQQFRAQQLDSDYGRALTAADPIPKLLAGNTPWLVAHADLIVDPPEKVLKRSKSSSKLLIGQLAGLWVTPNRRALIVSPYFVPGATGMRPERSYQPRLVREKAGKTLTKRLQWHDVPPGQCTRFRR